jgi:hypothetical protein
MKSEGGRSAKNLLKFSKIKITTINKFKKNKNKIPASIKC